MGRNAKFNDKEKWCARHNNRAGAWVTIENFGLRSRSLSGREDYCKDCKKQINKEGIKYRRKWYLKVAYGISEEQRQQMLKQQNERCAICGLKRPLDVDHNHDTGVVRQLLCRKCNQGLGLFNENPALLSKAAAYLEKYFQK